MSIVSLRDIPAFEEITVCYNYRLDAAPRWYTECWARWSQARPDVRGYKIRNGALRVPVKVQYVLVLGPEVLYRAESLPAGGLLLHYMLIVNQHHFCL